jgi:hypothetical protein
LSKKSLFEFDSEDNLITDYIIRSRDITGRNMFFDYTDQLYSYRDTLQKEQISNDFRPM